MLLEVGRRHERDDLISAGTSAASALLDYHHWQHYDDGTCTVSYYPHTRDEVINTAADVVALLIAVPAADRSQPVRTAVEGLLRMILAEQQPDGSWHYCTERYYRQTGSPRVIDAHHTAMVLRALVLAASPDSVTSCPQERLRESLEMGVQFFTDHLVLADGKVPYFPDGVRETSVVGYTESISAFCACLQAPGLVSPQLRERLERIVPQLMEKSLERFLDRQTFDVACCRFLGRPYQIQSARWGSAPLMHAITDFLTAFRFTGDGSCTEGLGSLE